jgi:hypothetical protein
VKDFHTQTTLTIRREGVDLTVLIRDGEILEVLDEGGNPAFLTAEEQAWARELDRAGYDETGI